MLLSPTQAAQLLGVHKRTLLEWIADGRIKVTKLTKRTYRIALADLPISEDAKKAVLNPTPEAEAEGVLA